MKWKNEKRIGLFIAATLFAACLNAQERPKIITDIESDNTVTLVQPPLLEQVINMKIANNALHKGVQGWRIRIFSNSGQKSRQRASYIQDVFSSEFEGIHAYRVYNEPNYQIFVGDFRTKTEALYHLKQIKKKYDGAFIVHSVININSNRP